MYYLTSQNDAETHFFSEDSADTIAHTHTHTAAVLSIVETVDTVETALDPKNSMIVCFR